jgi:hypothetical protein
MLLNPQWIASLVIWVQTFSVPCNFFYFFIYEYVLLLVIHMYFLWHFAAIGCWPSLMTIPVWVGLYKPLSNEANKVDMMKHVFCRQFFIIE